MCEYHLKGNCFHPEKVGKGNVATNCDVHACANCTNRTWQTIMIKKDINYHQTLLNIALKEQEESIIGASKAPNLEIKQENRFKNTFGNLFSRKNEISKIN